MYMVSSLGYMLGVLFIRLLPSFYTLLFSQWFADLCYIQTRYIWCLFHMLDNIRSLCYPPNGVFVQLCVCISLFNC